MKLRRFIAATVLAVVLATSGAARAANEPDPTHDARTEGYGASVQVDGSTALLWIMYVFVSIIAVSALFKDSKRARTE
ncbi:MAG TPA: hypothetical protein VLJ39_09715 [Tepidisphaeraceae bacterium]|nr:hypothetical protein [Tepidisphaeraceae bacterium]